MKTILHTDSHGFPKAWISAEDAATLMVMNQVAWTQGPVLAELRGGRNAAGEISCIQIPAVIGSHGRFERDLSEFVPFLGARNDKLFKRDRHVCAYCHGRFPSEMLSRDHVMPRSRGGQDVWTNVVTSCKRCNTCKGARTPEEAGMPLIYTPYAPNYFEDLILARGERTIIADQMAFIEAFLPAESRLT